MENKNPVIIMDGMEKEQIIEVMKLLKEKKIFKDVIFASTTETSKEWKVKDLILELKKEHIEMKKIKKEK